MSTPICEQLGIEFPIFAFSHCRDVIAAVSKAGGFGVLGALAFDDRLRQDVLAGQRRRLADFGPARTARDLATLIGYRGGPYPVQ